MNGGLSFSVPDVIAYISSRFVVADLINLSMKLFMLLFVKSNFSRRSLWTAFIGKREDDNNNKNDIVIILNRNTLSRPNLPISLF